MPLPPRNWRRAPCACAFGKRSQALTTRLCARAIEAPRNHAPYRGALVLLPPFPLRGGCGERALTRPQDCWPRSAVTSCPIPRLLVYLLLIVTAPVTAQVAGGVVQDLSPSPLQLAELTQASLTNVCFNSSPFGASSELSFGGLQLVAPPSVAKLNVRALFAGSISCR